jgi:anti-sigma factor ChrR (cupin superfamily)
MDEIVYSCKQIVALVTEYLEGSLETSERVAFERHVVLCPPCRGYLAQMRTVIRLAGGLTEDDLSPAARAELVKVFAEWKNARRPAQ